MPTSASQMALENLRDLSTIKWYVIPLLAIVFYIYTSEIKKARESGNWNAVLCGLTVFGMDFINETWNGWVFHLTQRSALWTAPGDTALRTMVGWNIEIIFMFAISGIIYYNTLSDDKKEKILMIPNRWFWAIGYAAFCVFVECLLNKGGHLVWEYPWWNLSFKGVWLIFLFGYFHFYVACIIVLSLRSMKARIITVSSLYIIAITANIIAMGFLGWVY
ncbi:MAG: hypothetical protein HN737_11900 [Desulfobacterales bacterium]|jgi:hypothetical protein|nr:hypothetical protein [Desulfobacteraceae bacterium]MBT7087112.1 hypothetical protein [Desulfobacterales bacterium]MBT7698099.1 hypothetical protein [Desulfobacterales bacterium]